MPSALGLVYQYFTGRKLQPTRDSKKFTSILVRDAHLVRSAQWMKLHCEVGEDNLNPFPWSHCYHISFVKQVWIVVGEVG